MEKAKTLEERRAIVDNLRKRHTAMKTKKDMLHGRLESLRQELAQLSREISEAGLDPRNLKKHRQELETEIDMLSQALDTDIREVESAVEKIENTGD